MHIGLRTFFHVHWYDLQTEAGNVNRDMSVQQYLNLSFYLRQQYPSFQGCLHIEQAQQLYIFFPTEIYSCIFLMCASFFHSEFTFVEEDEQISLLHT